MFTNLYFKWLFSNLATLVTFGSEEATLTSIQKFMMTKEHISWKSYTSDN